MVYVCISNMVTTLSNNRQAPRSGDPRDPALFVRKCIILQAENQPVHNPYCTQDFDFNIYHAAGDNPQQKHVTCQTEQECQEITEVFENILFCWILISEIPSDLLDGRLLTYFYLFPKGSLWLLQSVASINSQPRRV